MPDKICTVKYMTGKNHCWVDGVCGYQIASGNEMDSVLKEAIRYILFDAEKDYVQRPLWDNKHAEIVYLAGLFKS